MKRFRYFISLISVSLLLNYAFAAQPAKNLETVSFTAEKSNVKILGRTYFENDVLWMGHTDSGVEFNVSAKHLDVTIAGDNTATGSDKGNNARIVAFVNDERVLDTMIIKKNDTYTIFDGSDVVEGVVRIIKVSECAQSLAGIKAISVDKEGKISPAAERNLKIEFIGDSITCGYGVDDLVKENHFKTSTEDGSKTYAYKTAQALDADYSMVCVSGCGVISAYSDNGSRNTSSLMPNYYEKLGFSWNSSINGKRPQNFEWDFSAFVPDFVVINLGTNDASYTKGNPAKVKEYKDGYIDFIKVVRAKNPQAKIICSLGIMGQDLCAAISDAVKTYSEETGDTKIKALKFNNQIMSDGIAADWHPSEKTHKKASALLIKKIKEE